MAGMKRRDMWEQGNSNEGGGKHGNEEGGTAGPMGHKANMQGGEDEQHAQEGMGIHGHHQL